MRLRLHPHTACAIVRASPPRTGDKRLFIRNDELDAAWQLFTPVLKAIEDQRREPESYPYGSRGPLGAHYLAANYRVRWGDLEEEEQPEEAEE